MLGLEQGVLLTREKLAVLRGVTTGGSSMLYLGTAYDPDPDMWSPFGFDLQAEAAERRRELGVAPLPDRLIASGALRLGEVARDQGYPWAKLDKFVDADRCVENCNLCVFGCRRGAKWHARDWVREAVAHGATLLNRHTCQEVLREGRAAAGVRAIDGAGRAVEVRAPRTVIAAGGVGSPMILQRSGLRAAGQQFFFDPFVMTTGVFDRPVGNGVMMATGMRLRDEGIVITDMRYPRSALALQGLQVGKFLAAFQYDRSLPLMIKIRDDMSGSIDERGRLSKSLTADDRDKLERGKVIAERLLRAAGAAEIWHSPVGAAHPGGTCAMGRVVDANLETELAGLHVCDASVVPAPFGIPPTLTCLALARRLSRHLEAKLAN
jgi:choline dehydrogenase-like flavoprotein